MNYLAILYSVFAMFGFGIGDILLKKLSSKSDSIQNLFFIQIFSLVFTLPILFYIGKFNLTLYDIFLLIVAGAFDVLAFMNFLKGIKIGELAIVTPITAANSIITVILSVIFLNETLSSLKIVAIIVAVVGIVLTSTDIKNLHKIHTSKGILNAIAAFFCWGIYVFIIGLFEKRLGWQPTFLLSTFVIVIMTFILYFLKGTHKKKKPLKLDIKYLIIIGFLYTLGWFFMNLGFSLNKVSIVSVIISMAPAVTVTGAVIFLKEKLVPNQIVGIGVIMLALALISI